MATLFALSVGLASGMWAVVDAALLRPLPYRDGDALVVVLEDHPQRGLMALTPANFLDWVPRTRALRSLVIDAPSLDFRLAAGVAFLPGFSALASAYWLHAELDASTQPNS